jgi:CHAD domain-containing protein
VDGEDNSLSELKSPKTDHLTYPVHKKVGLEPIDTLAEAGRKVLAFHFAHLLQAEAGARRGKAVNSVHQMRVAGRRMRTTFRLLGTEFSKKTAKPLVKWLKATTRALGQVRDLDVLIEALKGYQRSLPTAEQAALLPLLEDWQTKRKQAHRQLLDYLDSKKYLKFKSAMLEFVQTEGLGVKSVPGNKSLPGQLRHLLPGLIYDRYQTERAYAEGLDPTALDSLHQLRLRLKQLRYVLQSFQEVLGPESKKVIEEITTLQDYLGHLNDADMAYRLLDEWNRSQAGQPSTEAQSSSSLAAYCSAKLAEREQLIANFPEAWERFNRPELRRDLALATSAL